MEDNASYYSLFSFRFFATLVFRTILGIVPNYNTLPPIVLMAKQDLAQRMCHER